MAIIPHRTSGVAHVEYHGQNYEFPPVPIPEEFRSGYNIARAWERGYNHALHAPEHMTEPYSAYSQARMKAAQVAGFKFGYALRRKVLGIQMETV